MHFKLLCNIVQLITHKCRGTSRARPGVITYDASSLARWTSVPENNKFLQPVGSALCFAVQQVTFNVQRKFQIVFIV